MNDPGCSKSAPGRNHRIEKFQVLQAFFDVGPKRKECLNPATGTLELPQLAQEIEHNPFVHLIEVLNLQSRLQIPE
jgi:hypothetical protein